MSNTINILKSFKQTLITFMDELIGQFPKEGDLVIARIFLKDQIPIVDVMNKVCLKIVPLKQMVKDRNDEFFINHNVLFEDLQKSKVNHFKTLWRSGNLDEDDKEIMFRWFDSFILLAQKYQESLI